MTTRPADPVRRRWRYYTTTTGTQPVKAYLDQLESHDHDAVRAAMLAVQIAGLAGARHLRGDVYELRASRAGRAWRVLFAAEGRTSQVLLAVTAFEKKSPKTPPAAIDLAQQRLADWRRRARPS